MPPCRLCDYAPEMGAVGKSKKTGHFLSNTDAAQKQGQGHNTDVNGGDMRLEEKGTVVRRERRFLLHYST